MAQLETASRIIMSDDEIVPGDLYNRHMTTDPRGLTRETFFYRNPVTRKPTNYDYIGHIMGELSFHRKSIFRPNFGGAGFSISADSGINVPNATRLGLSQVRHFLEFRTTTNADLLRLLQNWPESPTVLPPDAWFKAVQELRGLADDVKTRLVNVLSELPENERQKFTQK